ncbi:MAG: electron transport complex subunit E [Acidobacteria bacterium]|nr:electron transport complex subunit E [Acidobacteriota bacterium]
MKKQWTLTQDFLKGFWEQNPIFVQVLGMCPTLAVTVSAINGIAMALATTFVLVCASLLISMIRKLIPTQVRIASFIVVIATFVTIVDLVMQARFPGLSKALGPFVPLIVVNCLVLGRQEAFASKNNPLRSVLDALGMGIGFLMALFVLGSIRELLASRTILGYQVLPDAFTPWLVMILPAGAFLTLGLLMGTANWNAMRQKRNAEQAVLDRYRKTTASSV